MSAPGPCTPGRPCHPARPGRQRRRRGSSEPARRPPRTGAGELEHPRAEVDAHHLVRAQVPQRQRVSSARALQVDGAPAAAAQVADERLLDGKQVAPARPDQLDRLGQPALVAFRGLIPRGAVRPVHPGRVRAFGVGRRADVVGVGPWLRACPPESRPGAPGIRRRLSASRPACARGAVTGPRGARSRSTPASHPRRPWRGRPAADGRRGTRSRRHPRSLPGPPGDCPVVPRLDAVAARVRSRRSVASSVSEGKASMAHTSSPGWSSGRSGPETAVAGRFRHGSSARATTARSRPRPTQARSGSPASGCGPPHPRCVDLAEPLRVAPECGPFVHRGAVREPRAISGCQPCGGRAMGHRARSAGQLGNECEDGSRPAAERRSKMGIISWIVVGAIAGILAGFLVTGDEGLGIIGRILLGIVGAVVGGFIAGALFRLGTTSPGSTLPRSSSPRSARSSSCSATTSSQAGVDRDAGWSDAPHREACSARAIGPGADLVRACRPIASRLHVPVTHEPSRSMSKDRRAGHLGWSSSSSLPPPMRTAPPPN